MKKNYLLFLFVTGSVFAQQGNLCTDPIVITSLPYTTTDDTANYGDNYDPQTTTHPDCNGETYGNYYHGGNDVIYAYTPTSNGTIKVELPNVVAWTGLFIYTSCENIGIQYAGCSKSAAAGNRTIDNFAVTAGQTYYIYLSTWPSPQTFAYTLNVTNLSLDTSNFEDIKAINLYPNPVKKELIIDSNLNIKSLAIFTINGQHILQKNVSNNTVSLSELAIGCYIVQLIDTDGVVYFKKLLKSN